ncbi:putative pheromone-regulated membrane protein [Eutypa lata UCREL1]|uniref:Putative pheromone-regulated membrane protein n=1 Tax=Eutypa lata (strain UCR-EL1) TaxID=1287681 RepID=M7SU96_EUTLA|nr:putative pheromone-regulated membrane protein [Eutypa lata UCREL1]
MGLFGGRTEVEPRPEQKWDAISLRDFKSSSVWTALAYGYLHFGVILSVAVYGVDTFTAINLLAFDTWSSTVQPSQIIPFSISKWLFTGAIIASFINLILEHIRSLRVRNRGNVAECYLDNLAVRMESLRWGKGQGWRRFLVFAELTKSKKGAEYVALFTYFSFQC